jgi:hypothetical protein
LCSLHIQSLITSLASFAAIPSAVSGPVSGCEEHCLVNWSAISFPSIPICPGTHTNVKFCLLFYMGVKLCLSHWGKNIGWECSRRECKGRHLGLRGTRSEQVCIKRNFMICAPHQILCGRSIKKNDMRGACGMYGRGAYRVLVRTPKRKTPLGRHGCSWEDNIKINIKVLGWRAWAGEG